MNDPGKLTTRLTLETPVESGDGQGGVMRSYAAQNVVWAQLVAHPARDRVAADDAHAVQRVTITLRGGIALTRAHRFTDGARIYRIISWRDRDRGAWREIDAETELM
ncbi:head-tail adaptor protein [Rhodopseudomonas sp. HC1]|uniref:head-tail adaptor protein n=1 Tax=Rhodopseudomonas infernalis TaxID=2897386 RepID=UPI001EE8CE8F|nr:head-tail adaptor protein [Rhodopseudomonas infernalis]MCG6203154.1 head-tail adaptor protein [Rhodopseudomonas infernalis]